MTTDLNKLIKDRAEWLLDAVATSTQDRRFLRGEPEYDSVAGEAIMLNGKKAMNTVLSKVTITHQTDKETILTALFNAYRNAGEAPLYSDMEQSAHRSGVRDVAVRLGIYDDLVHRLGEVCSIEGCDKLMVTNLDGDHLCQEHANEWVRGEGRAAMENDES